MQLLDFDPQNARMNHYLIFDRRPIVAMRLLHQLPAFHILSDDCRKVVIKSKARVDWSSISDSMWAATATDKGKRRE
jgi:hypothetical protein